MATEKDPARLPERPNLDQLRRRARERQRRTPGLTLSAAQLQVARRYGVASWPRLVQQVREINARTWEPPSGDDDLPAADRLVRWACGGYSGTLDTHAAVRLLAADPGLPARDAAVAAAVADADALRTHLRGTGVDAPLPPFGWPALMYLAFSRVNAGADRTIAAARVLLEAGADPDAGRYFHGFATPFTVLTGVLGGGEGDQPGHPHALALARLLLAAGADPNDAQALYNRQFDEADDWLRLLLDHGLGRGDGGPWRRRLPDLTPPPAVLLRGLLDWAVVHDQRARVALLADHGTDLRAPLPRTPLAGGRTPMDTALLNGHRQLAEVLRRRGAGDPTLTPVEHVIGDLLAGVPVVDDGRTLEQARRARPALAVWAAALTDRLRAARAVSGILDAGFGVDALGRSDVPVEQPWQTALHTCVEHDDAALVRLLLARGADRTIRDRRFDATPAQWAEFFGRPALRELLD